MVANPVIKYKKNKITFFSPQSKKYFMTVFKNTIFLLLFKSYCFSIVSSGLPWKSPSTCLDFCFCCRLCRRADNGRCAGRGGGGPGQHQSCRSLGSAGLCRGGCCCHCPAGKTGGAPWGMDCPASRSLHHSHSGFPAEAAAVEAGAGPAAARGSLR